MISRIQTCVVFLLLFTGATFTAIRHASVSSVLAIGTAAPIITTVLQVAATGRVGLSASDLIGLVVTLLVVPAIIVVGLRQEQRVAPAPATTPQSV